MRLYHGTNNPDLIGIRRPISGNTVGFYLTTDPSIAANYGCHVLEFEIPNDCSIKFIIRPLGNTGTNEWIVVSQKDFIELLGYEQ